MNYYLRKIGNFFNFTGMRREIAEFLNTDLQYIRGVGPVMAERFNDVLGGRRVLDFLLHKPAYVRNREITESIANVDAGATITIPLMIKSPQFDFSMSMMYLEKRSRLVKAFLI